MIPTLLLSLLLAAGSICSAQEQPLDTPEAPPAPVAAAAAPVAANDAAEPPATNCGATANGATVDQGRYWYTCKAGSLEPSGCITDAKARVNIGQTFVKGIYELRCVMKPDNHINIEYSACVYEGRVIAAGGSLDVAANGYWLSCDKERDFVVQHISGCLHNGKRLKKAEKIRTNDGILWECRDQSPFPKVDAIGCVANGKDFLIGETITDAAVWYICNYDAGKVSKKAIGCIFQGKTQYDGQVYQDGAVLKQCRISNKTSEGAKPVGYGCVRPDGLKGFGCRFTDGASPRKFLLECAKNANDEAYTVQKNCVYESGAADYYLDPGCYRIIGSQGVGCKKGSNGLLDYVIFAQSEAKTKPASEGLKEC